MQAYSKAYAEAVALMRSRDLAAFDLDLETAAMHQAYGETPFGSGCLLARRLVEHGVRYVEVVTDGFDTGNLEGLDGDHGDVRNVTRREGFMVYAIGMEGMTPLQPALVDLVENTGGGHFHVKLDDDIDATFARVAEELRRQYVIGFTPLAVDGKEHKLDVKVKRPGVQVRARRNYVAPKKHP